MCNSELLCLYECGVTEIDKYAFKLYIDNIRDKKTEH